MNIIAVDDEHFALLDLQQAIEAALPGCSLSCFATPGDALAHAEKNTVNTAFLDIEMSGMNGLALAKKLKDLQPKTNIVFVTGYSKYLGQAFSIHASGYVLKPAKSEDILKEIENLRCFIPHIPRTGVFVRTFGGFEVFLNNKPIVFPRAKAKELFAYLIDRRGACVENSEIAAVLWEDRVYDSSLQSQTRNIISCVTNTFRDAGIDGVIIKSRNNMAVNITKIECDYYNFLNMKEVNVYEGKYMPDYSWAVMSTDGIL